METIIKNIYPVILSGGSGTRLWPLSTSETPKQFLPLFETKTLFQMSFERATIFNCNPPLIITNSQYLDLVRDQLSSDFKYNILVEPIGRDTAPAITLSLLYVIKQNPNAILLVMPADHYIPDHDEFKLMVINTLDNFSNNTNNHIITFGIKPTYPETGYGYIELSDIKISDKCYKVKQFKEKPNLQLANEFISKGNFYWNSGIFLFSAQVFYDELKEYSPELLNICSSCLNDTNIISDMIYINLDIFKTLSSISIDYALMEKSNKIGICPTSIIWSDIGSWASLWQIKDKDKNLNVIEGNHNNIICDDVNNSYIINQSMNHKIAIIGVNDLIIINSGSIILIVNKNSVQKVKSVAKYFI